MSRSKIFHSQKFAHTARFLRKPSIASRQPAVSASEKRSRSSLRPSARSFTKSSPRIRRCPKSRGFSVTTLSLTLSALSTSTRKASRYAKRSARRLRRRHLSLSCCESESNRAHGIRWRCKTKPSALSRATCSFSTMESGKGLLRSNAASIRLLTSAAMSLRRS